MNDGQPSFVPDSGFGESCKKKNNKDNNGGDNKGCELCGKKRHFKNSDCANNKNKK